MGWGIRNEDAHQGHCRAAMHGTTGHMCRRWGEQQAGATHSRPGSHSSCVVLDLGFRTRTTTCEQPGMKSEKGLDQFSSPPAGEHACSVPSPQPPTSPPSPLTFFLLLACR